MPGLQGRSGSRAIHHAQARRIALNDTVDLAEWRFDLGVPGGSVTAVILVAAIALVVAFGLRALASERRRAHRVWLGALRIMTGLTAAGLVLQPRWTAEQFQITHGSLAILADTSRSMTVGPNESRAKQASALLARYEAQSHEGVSVSRFGGRTRTSSLERLAEEYPATEDETRILEAANELIDTDPHGEIGAIVVLSDGSDQSDPALLHKLERASVKVHTVALGADEELRDDSIVALQADPVAFLRQSARVLIRIRSSGRAPTTLPISLWQGEELVREAMAEPNAAGEAQAEISFTPTRLGRAVYRVSIPVDPDDAVEKNNERAFAVRVTRAKLRVLLVAGRPSWDERFLRAFLKRDPAVDLISFFILRTSSDLTMAPPDELALIPFPTDELFSEHLGSFDLVIFQNFDFEPYQMARHLPRIRDYVRRGGAFAMLGGDLSFASGGYADTPLAEILPVTVPPTGTPETRSIVLGTFQPRVVREMARHPLLELIPETSQNAAAWARLSPLQGANVILGLRGDGIALLTHPTRRTASGAGMPVLAVGTAGRGRTLALGTDTTYRWGITTGGRIGDASSYERFWDRAFRWLTRDPSLEPARITTDKESYGPEAEVRIDTMLRDSRYEPLSDREIRLTIVDRHGEETASERVRTDSEGKASTKLIGPSLPGGYRVTARPSDSTEDLAEEGFVVETGGNELADPRARPDLLRQLSDATGGAYYEVGGAPDLADFDTSRARALGSESLLPFATFWAFLAAVLLFGAEWVLRRAWGRR